VLLVFSNIFVIFLNLLLFLQSVNFGCPFVCNSWGIWFCFADLGGSWYCVYSWVLKSWWLLKMGWIWRSQYLSLLWLPEFVSYIYFWSSLWLSLLFLGWCINFFKWNVLLCTDVGDHTILLWCWNIVLVFFELYIPFRPMGIFVIVSGVDRLKWTWKSTILYLIWSIEWFCFVFVLTFGTVDMMEVAMLMISLSQLEFAYLLINLYYFGFILMDLSSWAASILCTWPDF
jgi:hypothetical protein